MVACLIQQMARGQMLTSCNSTGQRGGGGSEGERVENGSVCRCLAAPWLNWEGAGSARIRGRQGQTLQREGRSFVPPRSQCSAGTCQDGDPGLPALPLFREWGGGEKLPWVTLWEPTPVAQAAQGGPPHGDICDSALEATTSALSHSHRRAKGALFQYPKSRPFV